MKPLLWIKRYVRLLLANTSLIKEGDRLWYYYLPTDRYVDTFKNRYKPHDVIERGGRYGVKHKKYDMLRKGFYCKKVAQELVDLEYLS